jgi:eukaryotic-like serine/threonine-protein kinase
MGEVYRARDTRLGRDVAIKILSDTFAADADRVARFQREAKTLASLNHPNIGGLHGLEEANGVTALIMELIEGEDLAQRIARGAIALDEALPLARQIAEAVEAAHEQGIIHRDLKPANIKVRPDGTVKVLDFGLAKATDPLAAAGSVSQSPTITTPAMTQAGMILGTAAYMSPEQAKGRTADTRADIWAFGVVLFEMLVGRRPFEGDEIADTLASILKSEPAWEALPRDTPRAIQRVLRRCLQKDRHQRLQHIGDARVEIDEAQRTPSADDAAGRNQSSQRERLAWASAVFVTAIIAAAGWWTRATPDAPEMRLEIKTSGSAGSRSFAISPDATQLAFTADGPRGTQLWIRSLDVTAPRALQGTDGGEYPFWSPDGRSIGFFCE